MNHTIGGSFDSLIECLCRIVKISMLLAYIFANLYEARATLHGTHVARKSSLLVNPRVELMTSINETRARGTPALDFESVASISFPRTFECCGHYVLDAIFRSWLKSKQT